MALISSNVPNLVNGVSQQADGLRYGSQAEEQINGYSSLVDGLTKRPPSLHISALAGVVGTNAHIHTINRDAASQYTAVIEDTTIKVFRNSTGAALTVTNPFNAFGYLAATDAKTAFRTLTVADYTIILNKEKTTAVKNTVTPTGVGGALVYVARGDVGSKYTIKVNNDSYSHETPASGAPSNTADEFQPSTIAQALLEKMTDTGRITGVTITNAGSYARNNTNYPIPVVTVSFSGGGAGAAGAAGTVILQTSDNIHFTVKEVVMTAGGDTYSTPPTVTFNFTAIEGQQTLVATATGTARGAGVPLNTFLIRRYGATLHFAPLNGTPFTINTEDSQSGSLLKPVKESVQHFADLPIEGPHNFLTKVEGDPEEQGDEYYVKFLADDPAVGGSGKWAETVAGGISYQLDETTMPHVLIDNGDSTFTFKPATYIDRKVGDLEFNPNPSFVAKKINDVFFFKNRLGFAADENIIFSEAGEFFNFFRTTIVQLLDGDPIDVALSSTKVSIIRAAVPFYDRMVLFSEQAQFTLQSSELLTPKTVSIQQSTSFASSSRSQPVAIGKNIYFSFPRNDFSGLQEYFINGDTQLLDGYDVTSGVPKYIKGNITKLAASDNEQVLVALSDGMTNGLYVYKYFFTPSEKLQAAWFKMEFSTGVTVLNVDFIDSTLWLTVKRGSSVFLEKMAFEAGQKDTGSSYTTLLDRRTAVAGGSYDSATDLTTFTVPYSVSGLEANTGVSIVTRKHGDYNPTGNTVSGSSFGIGERKLPEGVILNITSVGSTTLTVKGDYHTQPVFIGIPYTMTYTVSRPILRAPGAGGKGQVQVTTGRYQLLRGFIAYNDSRYFRVEVTPENRDTYKYVYNGRELGTGTTVLGSNSASIQDGIFRFPIMSKNDQVTINLINDSPFPSQLVSLDFEANFRARSQRFG